jgi:hypothetical protein
VSPLPVQMEDHWSPVPGVDPGRARLMWFMRVGDTQQVAELARLGWLAWRPWTWCPGSGCT